MSPTSNRAFSKLAETKRVLADQLHTGEGSTFFWQTITSTDGFFFLQRVPPLFYIITKKTRHTMKREKKRR